MNAFLIFLPHVIIPNYFNVDFMHTYITQFKIKGSSAKTIFLLQNSMLIHLETPNFITLRLYSEEHDYKLTEKDSK